jgi:Lrp/AsnC family leucine-responsive transcriptional regulator
MIDKTDRKILDLLQAQARITNVEIARRIRMAPSAVLGRIRRLERRGIIRGYETRLDPHALGLGLVAFVFVRTSESVRSQNAERQISKIPEVQEVHHIAGEDCFLVKVRVANTEALSHLLREKIGKIHSVVATRTTIVLSTQKESSLLPLPDSGTEAADE